MKYLLIYLIVVNIISTVAVLYDKNAARSGRERVRESSLFALAFIGGSFGMYAAMRVIHHKTRKKKFMVGIPVIIILQIALMAAYYFVF